MYITTPLVKTDKGCFMFTVQPFCLFVIIVIISIIILLINVIANDVLLFTLSLVFFLWLCRNLLTLKIYVRANYLVKLTGQTFKRKTIIMLKNISHIQIYTMHPRLPSLVRLNSYNQILVIIGLNGVQRQQLEKHILQLK